MTGEWGMIVFCCKIAPPSGEAIIETGGDLDTSESDGEVEVR